MTHHIQPLEMGGTDAPENKVRVCDTGHYNIHRSMAVLHKVILGVLPKDTKIPGTGIEKALAAQGYSGWQADGKPGKFVFEAQIHHSTGEAA